MEVALARRRKRRGHGRSGGVRELSLTFLGRRNSDAGKCTLSGLKTDNGEIT
jgi:hypothetical protein